METAETIADEIISGHKEPLPPAAKAEMRKDYIRRARSAEHAAVLTALAVHKQPAYNKIVAGGDTQAIQNWRRQNGCEPFAQRGLSAFRDEHIPKSGAGKPILIVMIIMAVIAVIVVVAWPYL